MIIIYMFLILLNKLSESEIIITLENKTIKIIGNNLKVKQMTKQELLINGLLEKVEFVYAK